MKDEEDMSLKDESDKQTNYVCEALEFDAPKFQNFDKTPYRKRLQIIEAILLNQKNIADTCYYEDNDDDDDDYYYYDYNDDAEEDIDWFHRVHNSHEASVPPSPPAPLITPVVIRKVGLGSPGRIIKSTSSANSGNSSSGKIQALNSPLRNVGQLSALSPLRLVTNSPLVTRSKVVHEDFDLDEDCLARSPSPPSLVNDVATLDDIGTSSNTFSRRESGNISDIDLFRDELIDMSSKTTVRSENALNKVTMMRPQRVLVSIEEDGKREACSGARKIAKVDAQLCPPPGVRKPEFPGRLNSSYHHHHHRFATKGPVQEKDIKKMLSEHNQRVRKR